jgi:hypothetical protein
MFKTTTANPKWRIGVDCCRPGDVTTSPGRQIR